MFLVQKRLGGKRQHQEAAPEHCKRPHSAKCFTQQVADFRNSLSQEVVLAENINGLKNGSANYMNGRC